MRSGGRCVFLFLPGAGNSFGHRLARPERHGESRRSVAIKIISLFPCRSTARRSLGGWSIPDLRCQRSQASRGYRCPQRAGSWIKNSKTRSKQKGRAENRDDLQSGLAGIRFRKQPLAILRLDELEREHIPRATASSLGRGILGFLLLAKYGALINCRTRQLFLSVAGEKLPVTRQAYEQMGFYLCAIEHHRGRHIEVVGTIGNETYSFLIDTGAENTMIMAAIRQKEKSHSHDERLSLVGIHDFKKGVDFRRNSSQFSSR